MRSLFSNPVLLPKKFWKKFNWEPVIIPHRGLRDVELYKQSPFIVQANAIGERLIGYEFHVQPVDASHFRLTLEPTFGMKLSAFFGSDTAASMVQSVTYQGVFAYGEMINNPYFRLKVRKSGIGTWMIIPSLFSLMNTCMGCYSLR